MIQMVGIKGRGYVDTDFVLRLKKITISFFFCQFFLLFYRHLFFKNSKRFFKFCSKELRKSKKKIQLQQRTPTKLVSRAQLDFIVDSKKGAKITPTKRRQSHLFFLRESFVVNGLIVGGFDFTIFCLLFWR